MAGVWRLGKCAVRNSVGRCGGWSGYESSKSRSTRPGSDAANIDACLPPYEWPPRKTRPEVCRRMETIAARSPCWSRSALPRCGGPWGRNWRNGRSQRRTVNPEAQNAVASATRSGESQFAPAPCVRTRQSPAELAGLCRNPRTGTSFCGASENSR